MTQASAIFDLAFGLFHLAFWRMFGWPRSLAPAGRVNRAVTQALNIMLAYVFFLYGIALFLAPSFPLLCAGAGFWLLRLLIQPILFGPNSRLGLVFMVLFAAGATLHIAAASSYPSARVVIPLSG